ncbi:Beta-lactamase-like protein 2 [Phytophthora citrophthora]|uniref:Beta-lactamase-like protein 2 n=1 Tax=Phytophthora citrophthora TaxID=4793 RepID=A0AAD9FYQ2_9STRA|nr:Beta-lactamase-like protein 2 [Phytophthora citrophthora]
MASLAKLKQCGAASIYPGHGPVVDDAAAKILEYITHRQQREDEILAVLKQHKRLTSSEVVDNIYDPLPYLLRLSARKATEKHLQKVSAAETAAGIPRATSSWMVPGCYVLVVQLDSELSSTRTRTVIGCVGFVSGFIVMAALHEQSKINDASNLVYSTNDPIRLVFMCGYCCG